MDYGLGRIPSPPDERDWPVKRLTAMIDAGVALPVAWDCPVLLNQGSTNHCVGFAWAAFKAAAQADADADPTVTDEEGHRIYREAKKLEGDPLGEQGAYLRSGAKVLKAEGTIDAYAFGTFEDTENWCQKYGPVAMGTNWYHSMRTPDAKGVVTLSGAVDGGHAWLRTGDKQGPADNQGHNSWNGWGVSGKFYLSNPDLFRLMDEGGEGIMAVRLTKPRKFWFDWTAEYEQQAIIWDSKVMLGYSPTEFRPEVPMTLRQVALVASRVKLSAPKSWLKGWATEAKRGQVRDTFPAFTWNGSDWESSITRRHMGLLMARYIDERGGVI
jgi:hypothetical protein